MDVELYWLRGVFVGKWNAHLKMLQHICLNYYFKFTFDTVKHEILGVGKGATMLGTLHMEKPYVLLSGKQFHNLRQQVEILGKVKEQ